MKNNKLSTLIFTIAVFTFTFALCISSKNQNSITGEYISTKKGQITIHAVIKKIDEKKISFRMFHKRVRGINLCGRDGKCGVVTFWLNKKKTAYFNSKLGSIRQSKDRNGIIYRLWGDTIIFKKK